MPRRIRFSLIVCLSVLLLSRPATAAEGSANPPVDLLEGAVWQYSTDGGKDFSPQPPTVPAETTARIIARTSFAVADPSPYAVLELTHGIELRHKTRFTLNGREIKGPMDGMVYRTIPAIDANRLESGKNVLTVDVEFKNISSKWYKAEEITLGLKMSLLALHPDVQFSFYRPGIGTCEVEMH